MSISLRTRRLRRTSVIERIQAKHLGVKFDRFHYRNLITKAVFGCRYCGCYFRQTPEGLIRGYRKQCGCGSSIVPEWELPELVKEND